MEAVMSEESVTAVLKLGEAEVNRTKITRDMVDRMEVAMRDIQSAQDELKAIGESAKEAEFSRREVEAMKTIAKLRITDKAQAAREKLAALERISKAVQFDLFG